jgi:hypothetical protein
MRLRETAFGEIMSKFKVAQERMCRNVYIETLHFLAALSPHIEVKQEAILALDAATKSGWPTRLNDNLDDISTVKGLLKYKGSDLNITISRHGDIYLKFPTVELEVFEIYSREKRQWKRQIDRPQYHTPEQPDSVELKAFMLHRLPTFEEIQSMCGTVKDNRKTFYNSCTVSLDSSDLLDKIEDAYKKYMSSTKRVNGSKERTKELVVAQYAKLRGIPAYDRWRITQKPVPEAIKL